MMIFYYTNKWDLYNEDFSKEMMSINVVKREDILKDIKEKKEQDFDIFEMLEEKSKNIPKAQATINAIQRDIRKWVK